MKKITFFTILTIISLNAININPAQAAAVIFDIKISPIKENYTTISWASSEPTKGQLIFGTSADKLNFFVNTTETKKFHAADITGLKKNQDYYFKIIGTNERGEKSESFVNYFNTKNLNDNRPTSISNLKELQATDKAFALSFYTDEPTKIEIRYGTERENLNKSWRQNSLKQDHFTIISNLQPDTRYYYEVIAKDEDNNISSNSGNIKTSSYSYDEIKITNLIPESYGQAPLMPEKAIIIWSSNILTKAEIVYGIKPDNLNKRFVVNTEHKFDHQATLTKLSPDTTYYYKIILTSDLNRKKFTSQIYTFKTAPLTSAYLQDKYQDGNLIKYKGVTYLIFNENKIPIYNQDKIKTLLTETSEPTKTIDEKNFQFYQESLGYWGAFRDGQVVKLANKNTIYLIDGKFKRPIANWQAFTYLNYNNKDIIIASAKQLSSYKLGEPIKHSHEMTSNSRLLSGYNNKLVKVANDPTIYLVSNGHKMPIINEAAFKKQGYLFSQVQTIPLTELESIPTGQLII